MTHLEPAISGPDSDPHSKRHRIAAYLAMTGVTAVAGLAVWGFNVALSKTELDPDAIATQAAQLRIEAAQEQIATAVAGPMKELIVRDMAAAMIDFVVDVSVPPRT